MGGRSTEPTATPLTVALGANAKVEILSVLANSDEPKRQVELATEIGVSEATISRSKTDLIESGFIEQTDRGLQCAEGIDTTIRTMEAQL